MVKYNLQQGAVGAGTGAAAGGTWGALLGALAGFGGGGSRDKMKRLPTMSPEQQQLFNQMLGSLGNLQGMGQQTLTDWLSPESESFQRFAEPYKRQFEQETVPMLGERFAGTGATSGALSSSGFGQSLSAASGNLQSQLAQMKVGLQQQALSNILQQMGLGLGAQPFAYMRQQGTPGLGTTALTSWAGQGFPGASSPGDLWGDYGPIIGNV